MGKKDYTPENLNLLEKQLGGKIKYSNTEILAKELDVKSVERTEFKDEDGNVLRFYLVRKNDDSVDLIKYERDYIFLNGVKHERPEKLSTIYELGIGDKLIKEDGSEYEILEINKNNLIVRRPLSKSARSYGDVLHRLLSGKLKLQKKSKLIINIKNNK